MQTLLLVTLLAAVDVPSAQRAFAELETMCAADGGRLWGRSLCGPTVLADPRTREAIRSDGTSLQVPESIGIANTSVTWDGREWTMVMLPLPQNTVRRRALLAHESFHRVQKELGFPSTGPANAHLDLLDGRRLLRLEWRALARALATRDSAAVSDALAFRAQRRTLHASAAEEERLLEMHEGLAEYTGWALAVPHLRERIAPLVKNLQTADAGDSFVRSFAYQSGPAWGALIEMRDPRWTRSLKPSDDLGDVARRVWNVRPAQVRGDYGASAVAAQEEERAVKKREVMARLRARYVEGPVLRLPLTQFNLVFDPNTLQPLEGVGTEYRTIEISDAWGRIKVTGGGLLTSDFKALLVPADGEGWTLTLNDGWRVVAGAREGDKTLSQ
ncbi:MAG TPA: hypothetical protein VGF28_26190 [Thermoanaerobaculia bacterium]|jgi:hypothetical protein